MILNSNLYILSKKMNDKGSDDLEIIRSLAKVIIASLSGLRVQQLS